MAARVTKRMGREDYAETLAGTGLLGASRGALAATQGTLSTLGETHDKLDAAFNENSPDSEMLVRQLGTEAERVKNFYQNLGSGAQWNQQLT